MEDKSVQTMWKEYLSSIGEKEYNIERKYSSWHFCDNEEDANSLAELVLTGVKRATASLYLGYSYEEEEVPKVGDYSIITDWNNSAKCIIETVKVDIVPFNEVTEEFAAIEGEGDKSLSYWKNAHWSFFTREMEDMGKKPSEDMLVVCEEFKVVYQ